MKKTLESRPFLATIDYMLKIILLLLPGLCYASDWKFETEKKGIKIYTRESKNSPIESLRAEGIIKAPVDKIVAILRDVTSATDWVPNLKTRDYVQNISDTEAILYDISIMPWPVQNRDMVVHHTLSISPDKHHLSLNFKSVKNSNAPKGKDFVRATIHKGLIEFHPRGEHTFMKMVILVDPNGAIPKFLVNLIQVKLPFEFLDALNKFADNTDKKPLPGVQALVDQLKPISL